MWILHKMNPNIDKHLWNLLVKFQLDPTVGFEVMRNSVKLNGRKFYAKYQQMKTQGSNELGG
jgi:Holliday junction resolvasome RuvABC ATP-dependent DNA helicase subunit